MINKESNDKKTLKSPVILRRIICILCVLLVLSGAGLVVVSAAPGSGDSPTLELYKRHASDNEAFDVSNMVPGDKVTKDFTVRIHHNDPLTLYFKAEVTEQTKKLGDVLQVSVTDEASGETVCRGTFAELDGVEFSQAITGSAGGSTDVTYRVDAWLDTSVGNEYQQALLKADLYWYVKDDGGHTEPTEQASRQPLRLRPNRVRGRQRRRRSDGKYRRHYESGAVDGIRSMRAGYNHPADQIPHRP